MASYRCCVGDCDSTSYTHKLFCMPVNDNLRCLWMSFLVPTNPQLLGLSKSQLLKKRICEKHFDKTQFDGNGVRIRRSYPCLIAPKEILHGVPLSTEEYAIAKEHNYCHLEEQGSVHTEIETLVVAGTQGDVPFNEHRYSLPPTSPMTITSHQTGDDTALQDRQLALPSTSKMPQTSKLLNIDDAVLQDHQPALPSTSDGEVPQTSKLMNIRKTIKRFYTKTRKLIRKCTNHAKESIGDTNKERLQNAYKFAENNPLMINLNNLSKRAKAFLLMQLRLARKKMNARRFSLEDKLFALALWKKSPKGYKLLENIFALPNKRTLARLSQKIIFDTGINKNVFEHIKMTVKGWKNKNDKLCSLVFDEVALTPRLIYSESKDRINGFVDIAGERKQKFADHALVFMVRGICSSWRQSIAYYFCSGTISAAELQKILKEMIPCLYDTGLIPLALVCDQGSTFRSCFKTMKQDSAKIPTSKGNHGNYVVHICGHDLFLFHDAPHLLKGIRNNLMEKDLIFKGKNASWRDIEYIYDLDNKSGHTRALPNLTAEHVDPNKIKKMNVKIAAQVLSARTAAMLEYTHSVHKHLNHKLDTMETTAEAVRFFDELFDSVNGSPGGTKGKLRCAVKPNSPHQDFWRQSIVTLKKMKFIDIKSKIAKESGKARYVRVPSLDGWIVTLTSFLGLAKLLFTEFGIEYFYPRYINQDPLENFFGRIRAYNCRNTNPDVNSFVHTFKTLAISNILSPHSKYANCEEDNGNTLIDFNYLFTKLQRNDENISPNRDITPLSSNVNESCEVTTKNVISEKVRVQISAYTAGYICRKISGKINCNKCTKTYTTREIQGIHKYMQHREYKRLKNNNLAYPKDKFLILYRECSQAIHNYLNKNCHKSNIKRNLKEIISKQKLTWLGCNSHKDAVVHYFIAIIIRLQCHNWCNINNKILEGKIEEKYVYKMNHVQIMALNKYKSYRLRKLKIKK